MRHWARAALNGVVISCIACGGRYSTDLIAPGTSQSPAGPALGSSASGECTGELVLGRCLLTLATDQPVPASIAVDAKAVYWTSYGATGGVSKVPLNGGAVTTLTSSGAGPWGIAVNATRVFWTTLDPGAVMSMPIEGGTPVAHVTGLAAPRELTLSPDSVFWAASDPVTETGSVHSAPLLGTGTAVEYEFGPPGPWDVAVDATNLYWTDSEMGLVGRRSIGGSAVAILTDDGQAPKSLVVDEAAVYWLSTAPAGIWKVPIGGGPTVELIALGDGAVPAGIAIDDAMLYWFEAGTNQLREIAKSGGEPTTLYAGAAPTGAASLSVPSFDAVAVDDTSAYWLNGPAGTVLKLTPK